MKIKQKCILPSATLTVGRSKIKNYSQLDKRPEEGDLVYGEVSYMGAHKSLESTAARIHTIHDATRAVFVYGNRYAPDAFEGVIPEEASDEVDLLSRSGVIGRVTAKNGLIGDPTRIRVLGYITDENDSVINTKATPILKTTKSGRKSKGAKLILCVGTAMNSGKSHAAAACCYAISSMGHAVRAAKATGTASLKDVLLMEDCGAEKIADFSYLGHPSTYMLSDEDLINIFDTIDLKFANNPDKYWVVEFSDGILQRETAMLLSSKHIVDRLHKLVFCASDAFGVIGGLQVLKDKFNLVPDAISGVCSSSPLALRELSNYTDIPIFNSAERDFKRIFDIIK